MLFNGDAAAGADAVRFAVACLTDKQTSSTLESALIEDGIVLHTAHSVSELAQTYERHAEIGILLCDLHAGSEKGPAIYRGLREKLPRSRDTAVIFLATAASINDVISGSIAAAGIGWRFCRACGRVTTAASPPGCSAMTWCTRSRPSVVRAIKRQQESLRIKLKLINRAE